MHRNSLATPTTCRLEVLALRKGIARSKRLTSSSFARARHLSNGEVTKLHSSSNGLPIGNISPHRPRPAATQRPQRSCPNPPGVHPWRSASPLGPGESGELPLTTLD